MELKRWLKKNKMTTYRLGKATGVTSPHIYRYLNGISNLGKTSAMKIHEFTNGEVSLKSLMFEGKDE